MSNDFSQRKRHSFLFSLCFLSYDGTREKFVTNEKQEYKNGRERERERGGVRMYTFPRTNFTI